MTESKPPDVPTILLVEDEPLVAMRIEDAVGALGLRVVGPAPSVSVALRLVDQGGFDGAVLDVNLRGERVDPVADALEAKGVPFIFISGYGASELPDAHRTRPVLTKPFLDQDLATILDQHILAD